jgi:hypothetical protein
MRATEYIQYNRQVNIRPIATAGVAPALSFSKASRVRGRATNAWTASRSF